MTSETPARGEILAHFWSLSADDSETRKRACEALMRDLRAAAAADGAMATRRSDDGEDDGADARAYALRRLTRGLSSGRAGARQGFALALSELATFAATPAEALDALDANVAPITKATKGQEARDILLGRLFGAAAIGLALGGREDVREEERRRCGAEVA